MRKLIIPLIIVSIVVGLMSVFVVDEGDRGIVIRFGRVLKNDDDQARIYPPGLQFKVPLVDRVQIMDALIQTMDDQSDRFVTSEKKDVIIDSYVKWKIKDFGQYYLSTGGGNRLTAEALLQRKVADGLRAEIGSKTIKQIVSEERERVMSDVLEEVQESANDIGIEVIDLRIKKINLPEEISDSIYKRMRAERETVARRHRSQGREKAEVIRAQAELEVATVLAEAEKTARVTRGEADAEVAKIYANSFNKEPEFYNFLRSLQAYEKSFNSKGDILVVDPNSEFFQYMKEPNARLN
ncbi:protease modulator HflC [Enterovibrio nigricans]|uniref:Protein HflC n=1 Tax=Enterovibrio nigricans DSM 22720 TaxID=1121868 RepID=A0A1T4UT93_9GAMM|nr:protease modulator HflC [Enterovibrio nigricans]SKA55874.1 membrane protease subunit HflC [Enterovibrio nigricans DSM 22720]